jgi:hypothetical protein
VIKILFKIGLPGSGKTLVSRRTQQLLNDTGYNASFMDDKLPLDTAVWADVSRFLDDPSRRTETGAVRGEHSIVHNPDAGIGRFRIDFLDGHGLNTGHVFFFDKLEDFLKHAGPRDIMVAECTPGIDDYSLGPDKIPVIHNPGWVRDQIKDRGLLQHSLIEEITASDPVRFRRNNERTTYNIPDDLFKREFSNDGGRFSMLDIWTFGNRYYRMENNGTGEQALLRQVDKRFELLFAGRIGIEGQVFSGERQK